MCSIYYHQNKVLFFISRSESSGWCSTSVPTDPLQSYGSYQNDLEPGNRPTCSSSSGFLKKRCKRQLNRTPEIALFLYESRLFDQLGTLFTPTTQFSIQRWSEATEGKFPWRWVSCTLPFYFSPWLFGLAMRHGKNFLVSLLFVSCFMFFCWGFLLIWHWYRGIRLFSNVMALSQKSGWRIVRS